MDDFAAPIKGIVKALDTGIKLAKRVSKSANTVPEEQSRQILQSAQVLESVLRDCSKNIQDAYNHTLVQCGEPFTKSMAEDSKYSCADTERQLLIQVLCRITPTQIQRTTNRAD